jgi:hypothetical protein
MIQLILLSIFFVNVAWSTPQSIEVWFLSAHKKAEVLKTIREEPFILRSMTAQLECQEMGDYCFDPQYGLYKKDDAASEVDAGKMTAEKTPGIPPAKAVERDLIDCDPTNYFDVFCGKAKKSGGVVSPQFDLWIDTSSSMREMDFTDKEGGCFRKSMLKRLDESCGFNSKVNVMMFDTSIKQAGTMDSLCQNQGLNDYKKLIDWIERSTAKKLIIITDIYELHKEFADYIESKHGKFRGDKDPMVASQLLDMVDNLARSCR